MTLYNFDIFQSGQGLRMAMGRGVRVFHAPGQSPYSVLVEQRGVEELILLESQVAALLPATSPPS